MDFGFLRDLRGVDFGLSAITPRSRELLARRKLDKPFALHVGCPVWAEKSWVGSVYPEGAKPADFLSLYSRQFGCIELNSTHYRMPEPAQIARWREETAPEFRFCPKFPQAISHAPDLRAPAQIHDARLFCERVLGLEERLGLPFFQLPPNFALARLPELDAFLRAVREAHRQIPIALELRHPSWFVANEPGTRALADAALDVLERLGISPVITDVAGRRDVSHGSLTSSRALVRCVGNGDTELHPTDLTRLEAWSARIAEWRDLGLSEVYFMAHEPDNKLAPTLAAAFSPFLDARGIKFKRWTPVGDRPGAQMGLFS